MQLRTTWKPALALCAAFAAGMLFAPATTAVAQDGARQGDANKGDPAKPEDGKPNEVVMEALGSATAFECYSSVGYLGALADGLQAGGYTPQYVRVRVLGLAGGISVAVKQLKALDKANLREADKKALASMLPILVGIVTQAKALAVYAEKKDPAQAKLFRETRQKTWDTLAKAIGLGAAKDRLTPGGAKLGVAK